MTKIGHIMRGALLVIAMVGMACVAAGGISGCGGPDPGPPPEPQVVVIPEAQVAAYAVFVAHDTQTWAVAARPDGSLLEFGTRAEALAALDQLRNEQPGRTATVAAIGGDGLAIQDGTHGCDVCLPPPHYP